MNVCKIHTSEKEIILMYFSKNVKNYYVRVSLEIIAPPTTAYPQGNCDLEDHKLLFLIYCLKIGQIREREVLSFFF